MTNPIADPLVEGADSNDMSGLVRIDATLAGAVTVTLNRPEARNAFNAELIAALHEAFTTLQGAEGVRVVFLRGEGEPSAPGRILNGCVRPRREPKLTTTMTPSAWRSC